MRALWWVARTDLVRWLRSPALLAATLVPAAGLALMVLALTYAVGRQPVALVGEATGPQAERMIDLIRGSDGFFLVSRTPAQAAADLRAQRVAAVITVPPTFDADLAAHRAFVDVLVNNVDLDFSDDVRRSVTEAVVEVDAPTLATLGETDLPPGTASGLPNPYRVDVAELDLRSPDIGFLAYQLVPVLALLSLTAGLLVSALSLATERAAGALHLVALSPAPRAAVVGGRLLGGVLASSTVVGVASLVAAVSGRLSPPPGRWPVVVLLLLLTSVSSVAVGVLLGLVTRRLTTTAVLGVNVATAFFLLGGGFTTIAFLPDPVQAVARAVPVSYAVDGLREALFYETTPHLGQALLALSLSAVGSLVIGALALARWSR